jgi:putative ABC transport system ATP-binding protein
MRVEIRPTAVLRAERLRKTYQEADRTLVVLDDLDVVVQPGETVAILGVSGTGKSTLLNVLSGIDAPDSGRLMVDGMDVTALDAAGLTTYRREKIGFVFQFYNLIPSLTAIENVLAGWEAVGRPLAEGKERAAEILERIGLARKSDRFPAQLSGGEQQRVAIARALVKNPALILADEPTGNLDPDTSSVVIEALLTQVRATGAMLLLVTHNPELGRLTDRMLMLNHGKLVSMPEPVRLAATQKVTV